MIKLQEFEEVCKKQNLILTEREFDEIVEYGLYNKDGKSPIFVGWSDCQEDDCSDITIALDGIHKALSGFSPEAKHIHYADTFWLESCIVRAKAAYESAHKRLNDKTIDLKSLSLLMDDMLLGEKEKLEGIMVSLGEHTLKEIYDIARTR